MNKVLVRMLTLTLCFAMMLGLCAFAPVATANSDLPYVELVHLVLGDPDANDNWLAVQDEWNAYLKETINASMTLEWTGWADWLTKYNLRMLSGEAVDMIETSSTWLDMWPNSEKGAFLPLDDLLPTYAPLTFAEVPQEVWDMCRFKGQIICFPENSYSQFVNHGLMYRGDWAKEAGLDTIKGYEDMATYFQYIKDNQPGVLPWDVKENAQGLYEGWLIGYQGLTDPRIPLNFKPLWTKSYEDLYTIVAPMFEDYFIDYVKLMKDWSDAGYWRTDAITYTGDTRKLMEQGLSGADQHHTETYTGEVVTMTRLQPGSDLQFYPWFLPNGNLVGEPITHGALSISANSKNPERAIMAYEMLRQDAKFFHYVQYGIEGKQYIINDDGLRAEPEGYDKDMDAYWSNFWGGRSDKLLIASVEDWQGKTALYDSLKQVVKLYPYGQFIFDPAPIEVEMSACNEVLTRLMPAISLGKVSDPQAAIDELRNALNVAGFKKVMEECQKQMDAYKALVEG